MLKDLNNVSDSSEVTERMMKATMKEALVKTNADGKKVIEKIQIGNIADFIESVQLNPLAPEWLDQTVRRFCEKFNLNYIGKSKLYQK